MRRMAWALVLVAACASDDVRADWPQFRGPGGQGHADAKSLPLEWSESENVAWKTAIPGKGWSSPVIADGRIWLTTALDDGKSLRAICARAADGRILHDVEVFAPDEPVFIHGKNSYASPTPLLDRGRVFVHFGTMGTAALDASTGKLLWKNEELTIDHETGPGVSPVLFRNLLIVPFDGTDRQFVAALDAETGKVVWNRDRSATLSEQPSKRRAFSTPLVIDVNGKPQLISPGADRLYAYDPATGTELWHVRYEGYANVPRVVAGDGLVYVCTGYGKPQLWAVRVDGTGDVTETHVAWKFTGQVPAKPSPVLVGKRIYLVHDQGTALCVNAETGETVWQTRLGGNYSASPLYAAGRIHFCSEEGKTTVLAPADEPRVLATNELADGFMASPAVSDGALFLRTMTSLYRIENK
ncbi:MAG: PQQ-binding-like beta-propeller repeat protein [Planctomycetaceae bacterium]